MWRIYLYFISPNSPSMRIGGRKNSRWYHTKYYKLKSQCTYRPTAHILEEVVGWASRRQSNAILGIYIVCRPNSNFANGVRSDSTWGQSSDVSTTKIQNDSFWTACPPEQERFGRRTPKGITASTFAMDQNSLRCKLWSSMLKIRLLPWCKIWLISVCRDVKTFSIIISFSLNGRTKGQKRPKFLP